MSITAQDLARREVYYCVSSLIDELTKRADSLDFEDAEALYDLTIAKRDYEEACREAGWEEVTDPTWYIFTDDNSTFVIKDGDEDDAWDTLLSEVTYDPADHDEEASAQSICEDMGWELTDSPTFYNPETGETSEADGWEELASEFDIEPHEWEAYEHWLVSDYLANKLTERGYTVREVFGLTVWARGTTGQAIYIDGVIEEIVAELNAE
jgi:hypothetical protein